MTKDERQALREKHKPMGDGDGGLDCNYCREGDNGEAWYGWAMGVEWPCDVIKLLDATENLKFNDLKTKVECDHAIAIALHGTDPVGINFNYCPKCGDSL